jgi:hypothetical protein
LLYFSVEFYNQPQNKRFFRWAILPFVVLFFVLRLLLMIPLIEGMHVGEDYYHGRKAWSKELAAIAGNRPVFIPNNLREASLYSYYSGKLGVTLYNRPEKKSQYEMWNFEDSLQEKEVLFVAKYPFTESSELSTGMGQKLYYAAIPAFQSYYSGITIEPLQTKAQADSVFFVLQINNHRRQSVLLSGNKDQAPSLVYTIEKNKREIKAGVLTPFLLGEVIPPAGHIQKNVQVPVDDLPDGEYTVYFGFRGGRLPDAWLSHAQAIHK